MLELINISKIYHNKNSDVKALDDINLKFSNQGMTFIIGSSGCGKTTLLNIIAGNDNDFDGEVLKDGKVESIEQEIHLLENLSILDNLFLVTDDQEEIKKLLVQFKLFEPNKKVKKLSGGERKRVQIIRSLLSKASYLICDEPTASLDHENGEMIMDLLKEISKQIGVIIVTHDIALVEKYKDRVIQMGKGCIIEDEEVFETNKLEELSTEKRKWKQQIILLFKMMKSRIGEMMFRYILLFLSVLTVFVIMNLFPSLNASTDAQAHWREGKNLILSKPLVGTEDVITSSFTGKVTKRIVYDVYDTYKMNDVNLVHDNIEGIIGYKIGWKERYNRTESWYRRLNIDGLRDVVEKYRETYETTGVLPFLGYDGMLEELNKIDEKYPNNSYPKDQYDFFDSSFNLGFSYSKGIHRMLVSLEPLEFRCVEMDSIDFPNFIDGLYINHYPVTPYELFRDVKLELMCGKMSTNQNEIVIDKSLAEQLLKFKQLTQIEELVGTKVNFNFKYNLDKNDYVNEPVKTHLGPKIISGVTYMCFKDGYQIFGIQGAFEKEYADVFKYQPELVAYSCLDFLLNPRYDSSKIATQLNRLLESKDSEFVVYNDLSIAKEGYQDPFQMIVFSGFALGVLVALYLVMHLLMNKRMKKESKILTRYHYPYLNMQIVMMFILFVLVGSVQYLMLPYLCDGLNQLANSIGMADIVSYHITSYIQSLVLVGVFIVLIEFAMYKIRNRI